MRFTRTRPRRWPLPISCAGRGLGPYLNDGYAKRDDGLMVASVHELQTLELLRAVRHRFEGPIYFDTFPMPRASTPLPNVQVLQWC